MCTRANSKPKFKLGIRPCKRFVLRLCVHSLSHRARLVVPPRCRGALPRVGDSTASGCICTNNSIFEPSNVGMGLLACASAYPSCLPCACTTPLAAAALASAPRFRRPHQQQLGGASTKTAHRTRVSISLISFYVLFYFFSFTLCKISFKYIK
jgi:hypothetical protein